MLNGKPTAARVDREALHNRPACRSSTRETELPRWYVLVDGPQQDVVSVKRLFPHSGFEFFEIEGHVALTAPSFNFCEDEGDVIDAGMELLASINAALRVSLHQYDGLEFSGTAEFRDGKIYRTMVATGSAAGLSGAAAVALAGTIGKPVRTKEERLASLCARMPEIADITLRMAAKPLTWASMTTAYESVAGLMSSKSDPGKRRSDYQNLVDKGWLTEDEADRFYNTAAYHRKGYPKSPVRRVTPMEHGTASNLIKRLFWRLVDELQPE